MAPNYHFVVVNFFWFN